jgi:hypothetical protein
MTATLFLPWLRRGIGQAIGAPDSLRGPLALRPALTAFIELADDAGDTESAESPLSLLGPGDVTGLAAGQIVRCEPTPGTTDYEPNYLPYVELAVPELPWLLTPAAATTANALRPWLVLVVVETRDGVELTNPPSASCPVLEIDGALVADELPPLEDSYAWAHVASAVAAAEVAAEVEAGSGAVVARLVCPRRLQPGRSYRAAIVPAFAIGRDAALGRPLEAHTDLQPAWVAGDKAELPLYHSWTFSTSPEAGDFEALCTRLEPDTEGGRIGVHAAFVDGAPLLTTFRDATFEAEGALVATGTVPAELNAAAKKWFEDGLIPLINAAADRAVPSARDPYVPERDDPVVGPPLYGAWHANRFDVPAAKGWQRTLNLRPASRAAAGLGAELVRAMQTELLAAAWDQVGELREVNDALNRGRLAAELARSQLRRFGSLPDAALLATTARVHPFVFDRGTSVARRLNDSAVVPNGLMSPAYLRATRPSTTIARFCAQEPAAPLASRVAEAFVKASAPAPQRPDTVERCAAFGRDFLPAGAHTLAAVAAARRPRRAPVRPARVVTTATDDVRGLAGVMRDEFDPLVSVRTGLLQRIAGLTEEMLGTGLPTRVVVGPEFTDPLFPRLLALDPELVVPGIGEFGLNRVRLLEVNENFVAAVTVGANHEWGREALWAEFPASLGATVFARFWENLDGARDLDPDIHLWLTGSDLDDHVGGAGTSTVVLIRGDLIRRYPSVAIMLLSPLDGEPPVVAGTIAADHITAPSFRTLLDANTVVVGFPEDPDKVLAEGWYVCLEEPFTQPRAGLDEPDDDAGFGQAPATSWANLTWANVARESAYPTLTHIRFADAPWLDGRELEQRTWGRNSAHMAGITFQQPFRFIIPADQLIGGAP